MDFKRKVATEILVTHFKIKRKIQEAAEQEAENYIGHVSKYTLLIPLLTLQDIIQKTVQSNMMSSTHD